MTTLFNFRDLAGTGPEQESGLRKGCIFRSAHPDTLNQDDSAAIRALGIRTIIDLRSPAEQTNGFKTLTDIPRVLLPLSFDGTAKRLLRTHMHKRDAQQIIIDICDSVYALMIDELRGHLQKLFTILLSADQCPVLIHCRGGKDRTGIVCAVIQMALEIDDDAIVQDYMQTNEALSCVIERKLRFIRIFSLGIMKPENWRIVLSAREQFIQTAIRKVRSAYGGIGPYLSGSGVSAEQQLKLKAILLTEPF